MSLFVSGLHSKCAHYLILYIQSVLVMQCLICKVTLLFGALYVKCPYHLVLFMHKEMFLVTLAASRSTVDGHEDPGGKEVIELAELSPGRPHVRRLHVWVKRVARVRTQKPQYWCLSVSDNRVSAGGRDSPA